MGDLDVRYLYNIFRGLSVPFLQWFLKQEQIGPVLEKVKSQPSVILEAHCISSFDDIVHLVPEKVFSSPEPKAHKAVSL